MKEKEKEQLKKDKDKFYNGIVEFGKTMIDKLNSGDFEDKYLGESYNIVANAYLVINQKETNNLLIQIQEKERQYLTNIESLRLENEELKKQIKKG